MCLGLFAETSEWVDERLESRDEENGGNHTQSGRNGMMRRQLASLKEHRNRPYR